MGGAFTAILRQRRFPVGVWASSVLFIVLTSIQGHYQEQYEGEEEGSEQEQEQEIMATLPLAQGNYLPRSPFTQSPNFDNQSNERPFVCPHCSADFIRQSNLSVHMMKVHGETVEVRTHQCSYCDKKFKYPNKRRLHEMTHTGEKPNVCQFCTMGFFKKSRLRVH